MTRSQKWLGCRSIKFSQLRRAAAVEPDVRGALKIVQNKIHFAAHGHTAAAVIAQRANAELPFMG